MTEPFINVSDIDGSGGNRSLISPANISSHLPPGTFQTLWDNGKIEIPLYSAIFLLAVLGNVLVILTLARNSRMRTNTNVFLLNLAFSDLIIAVLCMPFTLIGTLLRDFVFGEWLCRLVPFLQATSVAVSVWTLVALSIERYYAICHPLSSRRWQTLSHAYHLISGIWAGGAIAMLPILITSQLRPYNLKGNNNCREIWFSQRGEQLYNLFLDVVLLVIPLLALGATYYLIGVTLWRDMPRFPGILGGDSNASPQTQSLSETTPDNRISHRCRSHSSEHLTVDLQDMRSYNCMIRRGCTEEEEYEEDEYHQKSEPMQHCVELTRYNSTKTRSRKLDCETGEESPIGQRYKSLKIRQKPSDLHQNKLQRSATSRHGRHISQDIIGLRRTNYERSLANKQRVIKMLFVVVLEFFVCWTPIYVINTYAVFYREHVYTPAGYKFISFCQLLAYSSSCCNPITYCFMNRGFRNSFLNVFACRRRQ